MLSVETASNQLASMERPPFLLSMDRVTKDYKSDGQSVRALNDVSIQVGAGRFVALVGRSGCGKSTLLNLAGAMDLPTRGQVLIDGIVTEYLSEAQLTKLRREKIGFIFQSFQLLHTLNVIENVEIPLLLAGHSNARPLAFERLESVELADLAKRMPHQLSGGQMQRVAIARSLVHSPRILLADEPTGNLDTATGNSILNILQQICSEQKMTILMATHSAESASFVDTVVRMQDGQIKEIVRS